jgi:predicted metalloprotease with PDZ domain
MNLRLLANFASLAPLLTASSWACDPPIDPPRERTSEVSHPAAGIPADPGRADGRAAISHRVSFADARNHYVDVESSFPAAGAELELFMPVWTPGSYLVREFSRNLESVSAVDPAGASLRIAKTRKNRWRIATGGADRTVVRYRVYAAEMSVRTNWVSDDMGFLNGAATFLAPVGDLARPHEVSLALPPGWRDSITALPAHPSGQPHRYLAPSYDALVDSPILLGNPVVRSFDVGGVRHRLAQAGDTGLLDADRAAGDVARVVEAQRAFWGGLPYRAYDFLSVHVDGASGGLEHLDSTLLLSSPWAMSRRLDYARWLGLVSHELFHAWNVKRLRPVELGPFDYENEVYTPSLWLAEGVTSYYGNLLLARAGLIDRDEYLASLSGEIRSVETGPGRAVQPLALSSFDTWIKFYRPDENSNNASVDYYDKGAVVGFLLDAEIRRATEGQRSLDDVMRLAYGRYAGERGYRAEDVRRAAEEVAGRELGGFWRDFIDGVAPLDYGAALDYYGLRLVPRKEGTGERAGGESEAHLGLEARDESGRLRVTKVARGGPAWQAGVQPGDELIAIDDRRVPLDGLDKALARLKPGARASLLVARWGRVRAIAVVLGQAPGDRFELEVAIGASAAQRAHLDAWLGAD